MAHYACIKEKLYRRSTLIKHGKKFDNFGKYAIWVNMVRLGKNTIMPIFQKAKSLYLQKHGHDSQKTCFQGG